ncbi:MAG: GNAT family N-acetyltransferase [Pseudomonadota bacterium]
MSAALYRRAGPADAGAIAAMAAKLAAHQGDGPSALTAAHVLRDGFGPNPAFAALVAEQRGEAIGYALWHSEYDTDHMRPSAYLIDLYVEPAWRGRGVGRALMAASAAEAAGRGAAMLSWTVKRGNEAARRFYRRLGREQPDLFYGVAAEAKLDALAAQAPPAGVRLREARREDADLLAAFIADLLVVTGDGPPPRADIAAALARDGFGDARRFHTVVAEGDGSLLGHALFWPAYDSEHAVRGSFLSDLYVVAPARRQGVALALMGELARRTRAAGGAYAYWQIWEKNAPAIAFYRRFAAEDRTVMPCVAEGEAFTALIASAPALTNGRGAGIPGDGR